MNKIRRIVPALGFVILAVVFLSFILHSDSAGAATTGTATLSTSVQQYLALTVSSGGTVAFGSLTPGTPIPSPSGGTVVSVATNAANGYTLGLSDGSDTNSAMLHTDTTTPIADFTTGTIAVPVVWGSLTGVGITLFAADVSKEVKWGTGTTYNDVLNKYAAIPSAATTAHTVTGFHSSADTSSWAFKVDVPNSQKTGSYSGNVTFTSTAVLS